MTKDVLLFGVGIAVISGGPYLIHWIDEKLGISEAVVTVPRINMAAHVGSIMTLGLVTGLAVGYALGIR